jgi:tetrapyrrole methylase family protein / MazG family protein
MNTTAAAYAKLYEIIKHLRAPDGCPWDREQDPNSMRGNLIEEAYECLEAINHADPAHVKEELGDVMLVASMIGYMYEQQGAFTVAEVLETIAAKLVRRHPHVFGDAQAATAAEVLDQWQTIKVQVEGRALKDSVIDGVSTALPPLERAYKIQKKAAKVGFDWPDAKGVWDKAQEELEECREACASGDQAHLEAELGDLLFSVVNISRRLDVDPAQALLRTISKFDRRFRQVERAMKDRGLAMGAEHFALMDQLWDQAKAGE